MKNSECTICIMFRDAGLQKFRKEEDFWTEYSSNSSVRILHRRTVYFPYSLSVGWNKSGQL